MNTDTIRLTPRIASRRLLLSLRRDPLARVTSPAEAIRLADQLLTCMAISQSGSRFWSSIALEPLATLILAASPAGGGQGRQWVHTISATLHAADRDDTTWDEVQRACNQRRASGPMQERPAAPAVHGYPTAPQCHQRHGRGRARTGATPMSSTLPNAAVRAALAVT